MKMKYGGYKSMGKKGGHQDRYGMGSMSKHGTGNVTKKVKK